MKRIFFTDGATFVYLKNFIAVLPEHKKEWKRLNKKESKMVEMSTERLKEA